MFRKVGTIMDTKIIEKLKIVCARKRKPMKDIIDDAIRMYLEKEGESIDTASEGRVFSLAEVLSSPGGELANFALGGKGSGDFDEKDFD